MYLFRTEDESVYNSSNKIVKNVIFGGLGEGDHEKT
jgi:hypothetical protein